MDRRFRPTHEAKSWGLCLEPLEDRSLLSGLPLVEAVAEGPAPAVEDAAPISPSPIEDAVSVSVEAESDVAIEVVEWAVATNEGEEIISIAESELPQDVVEAVDARFPGAELVDAEVRDQNGSLVYGVSTEFGGRPIDVTLTNDGSILDTAYTLTLAEVPQPVHDWVEENFPGGMIGGAELVTESDGISYDLLIATEGGQFVEATVRLHSVRTQRNSSPNLENFAIISSSEASTTTSSATTASETPTDVIASTEGATSDPSLEPASFEAPLVDAPSHSTAVALEPAQAQAESLPMEPVVAIAKTDQAVPDQIPLGEIAFQAELSAANGLTECFPQVAGMINDLLPIDVLAVEQGLLQFLDDVDLLVDTIADKAVGNIALIRSAIVAALVVGARMIILESNKRRYEPVLVSGVVHSNWSWVLGGTSKVPRK